MCTVEAELLSLTHVWYYFICKLVALSFSALEPPLWFLMHSVSWNVCACVYSIYLSHWKKRSQVYKQISVGGKKGRWNDTHSHCCKWLFCLTKGRIRLSYWTGQAKPKILFRDIYIINIAIRSKLTSLFPQFSHRVLIASLWTRLNYFYANFNAKL